MGRYAIGLKNVQHLTYVIYRKCQHERPLRKHQSTTRASKASQHILKSNNHEDFSNFDCSEDKEFVYRFTRKIEIMFLILMSISKKKSIPSRRRLEAPFIALEVSRK